MQPSNSMIPSPMAPPPQYRPQQWMPQQSQQTQYQVPPPQQPAAASGYYYQQPPQAAPTQQLQPQPQQYGVVPAAQAQAQAPADDGIRSLWIGDLQYWMDEQYIYSCFALTGEVASAKVIRNKQTGQSEGYGFIEFVSHAAAERNLLTYNGTQMPNSEQTFRLNWASMGAGEKHDDTPEYTVFVGDLAADVTDYMLQETFRANYSSVKGAKVVTDKITGRTKGYGFVRFGDESEQLRAMTEMNGRFCSTRPMRIGPAASKQKVGSQTKASYQTSQGTQSEDDPSNTTEALRMLNGTLLGGQSIRLSWGRSPSNKQVDQNQSNGGYYGYAPGYETYGYAPAAQDPNLYYAGYQGYGNYPQPPQQPQ
ncbi:Polyadenylate-binding protein RBP45B [Abeliophyllum distichum]|uniref:Polyadenylate-binding protein RBP45B n=1 Tax=Abeliophyllum distichum TaxID=126358 RepID=A0ABD1QH79_9LAMI